MAWEGSLASCVTHGCTVGPRTSYFLLRASMSTWGAGSPPVFLLAVCMSDTCVLRGGTSKARRHGHDDRWRRLRVCGRSKWNTAHPKRPEDLSDKDRLEPSAEDQQVFLENTEAQGDPGRRPRMANHGTSTDPHLTQMHWGLPMPRSPHLDVHRARQAQHQSVQHHKLRMCYPPTHSSASPRIFAGRHLWSGPTQTELREGERMSRPRL